MIDGCALVSSARELQRSLRSTDSTLGAIRVTDCHALSLFTPPSPCLHTKMRYCQFKGATDSPACFLTASAKADQSRLPPPMSFTCICQSPSSQWLQSPWTQDQTGSLMCSCRCPDESLHSLGTHHAECSLCGLLTCESSRS